MYFLTVELTSFWFAEEVKHFCLPSCSSNLKDMSLSKKIVNKELAFHFKTG